MDFLHEFASEFEGDTDRFSGEPYDVISAIESGDLYSKEGTGSGQAWRSLFYQARSNKGYDAVLANDVTDSAAPICVVFSPDQIEFKDSPSPEGTRTASEGGSGTVRILVKTPHGEARGLVGPTSEFLQWWFGEHTDDQALVDRLKTEHKLFAVLGSVNVAEGHRGGGEGNLLLEKFTGKAAKAGVTLIVLEAYGEPGFDLEGWYARHGFKKSGLMMYKELGRPKTAALRSKFYMELLNLRPAMATAAQKVYDEWTQDEEGFDEVYGAGGICDQMAEALGGVIATGLADVELTEGGQDGDEHAWIVAQRGREAIAVDIAPEVYEVGGGYSWQKRPDVLFSEEDIYLAPVDIPIDDPKLAAVRDKPQFLYHGTIKNNLPSIMAEGLKPQVGRYAKLFHGVDNKGRPVELRPVAFAANDYHLPNCVMAIFGQMEGPDISTEEFFEQAALLKLPSDDFVKNKWELPPQDMEHIEPNDYFSLKPVKPVEVLTGQKLKRFLGGAYWLARDEWFAGVPELVYDQKKKKPAGHTTI